MSEFWEEFNKQRRIDRYGFDTTPVVFEKRNEGKAKDDTEDNNTSKESPSNLNANFGDSIWDVIKNGLNNLGNTAVVAQGGNPYMAVEEGQGLKPITMKDVVWAGQHFVEGAKAVPRQIAEGITAVGTKRAQNMGDPEMEELVKYVPNGGELIQESAKQAREDLMNNSLLKAKKIDDGNSSVRKFTGAVIENIPQMGLQAIAGPIAGSMLMGLMMGGAAYEGARERKMTDEQSVNVGLTDMPLEGWLEYAGATGGLAGLAGKGIKYATKASRFANSGAKLSAKLGRLGGWLEPGNPMEKRSILKAAAQGVLSEAPTEFTQQYVQQGATDLYDPNVSKAEMLYNITTNPKTFEEAAFAGAVGGVLGGTMGGALAPIHNRAIDKITAKTGTSYNSSVDNVLAQSKAGQEQAKIYDDVMAKREAQKKLEQRTEIQKAEAAEQEQRAKVAQQTQNAMPLGYEEFSDEIKQAINDNATKDVPPALIAAIIQQESGGNKTVVSPAGAQGLMQLMPGTASDNGVTDPFDVNDNVRGGVSYYTKLKKMFGGNDVVAIAAYNAGEGHVQEWIKDGTWDGTFDHVDQIPFAETRDYVKKVMSNWQGSISNGVYVNAGATPAEQMALIQSQNERDAAIREAYNQVANSQMAKDFALDLARTSTDPKVVNEVNRAVKLKDDKKLEEIARANGYVDEDLTPMPKKDTGNVFTTHNQAGAAQGNINTNNRVNISSTEENGGRPPIIAVDRKSMAAPTEMTVNDEANIVSDRIARALVGDTKNGNIAPISKQNVKNDTFIIKNGNGANSAVDTNISATVNTQPTGATVSGIQDVTNTLNGGELPTAEQSAVAINELQDAPQSQERDDLISALAKNINGESVAAPSQERTNQAVRTVAEPTVEPTATKEEALFTPTAQPRADAQDRLNEAVQKLQRRELPTKEESQAILADLAHLPDSDGVRQSRAIFEGIVRRDFSMFGKNNQAQMEALAAKEDAERRAAQESASSKTGISLVDGAVSSNKALSNKESRDDVKTAVNKENVNRRINELLNTLKTGTIPTNEEMESVLRDVDTLTNTISGYGNSIEAKMARVVFPKVMKGDFSIYRGATRKKLQESARAKQAEIERQNTGSNDKNPFAANVAVSIYDNFNQFQHPNVHQDNSLVGIQKKTHALVTDINEGGLYGKDVKENAKNKSLSKSARIGLASNRLTVMGVFKPNDNGGDFVFQFKHNSKKVGEIKFSLRDFCEYAEAGGNAHVPIRRNMETVFYNSDFFKTHFETPGKNTDKSYVRYKDNNHENPPRADFFVDGMGFVFKDLITAYDNRYYKGETVVEGTKVEANKNNKATKDFADDHLIVGTVTDKGIVEDKQLKNKIVNTMKDESTDFGEEKNTNGQEKQGDSNANTKAESPAQGQTKTENKNDGAFNKGVDKQETKENNEDNNAVINSTTKGADENDTGRPERSSGSRGRQGEERTAGTQEKGKDDTGAGRGVDSKHVGDVEQASVLRSGENQNDNEVRQSHSDDMERGKGTGEDKVQPHRSGSDVRLRERRSDDGQSTRNAVKGRDDTTGTDSGHENGSTESVGRTSGDEGGTGKKQTGESSESVNKEKAAKEKVDKEETEITKEKNNERPKPEAIRRGRFYSNKTERENVTALLSKPSERVNANKEALNVYLRVTNDGAITDMGSISLKPKDLKALSMFTGWGGLKTQLQDMKIGDNSWLKEHFSDEEITTMMNSTTTGYFTPPAVIDFMWKAVVKMNVQQDARILEPSMGIGNFVMQLPKEYKDAAHITGIELDKITGNMSQLLYGADGKTNIRVQGYEQNRIGDNSFDLVIGNVPFSSNSFKTGEKRFDVYKPLLHDFFFLKAVKQTRPGGLIAFITTSGTMDKVDSKIRKAIAQEATLIAAYRLPNNTFAGTGVVADIIFLQKNDGGKNTNGVDADEWMRSEKVEEVNGSGVDSYMNTYFMKHPENILGKLDSTYDWRSGKNKITVSPKEGVSLEAELSKGIRKLPKDIVAQRTEAISGDTAITTITSDIKIGKIFVGKDGKFYRSVGNEEAEIIEDELKDIPAKVQRQMKGLIRLADDYRQLLEAEAEGKDTKKLREEVNKGYKIARKGNKAIRKSKAYETLIKAGDGSISILSSIETADGTASEILKHPLIRKDKVTKNPTIGEAVLMSAVGGNVDINKVADLAHTTTDKAKAAFIKEGIAYVTPNGNWQTKEKYINGNIAEKLTDAETAFSYGNKDMERNIRDLKAVLPERLSMNMVNVGFGVTWITPEIYEDFLINELYGEDIDDWRLSKVRESGAIQVSMAGDVCNININKNELIYGSNVDSETWNVIAGGKCKNVGINDIINAALSNKELVVYDQVKKGNIEYKELNQGKTDAANAMVQKLLDDWQTYIRTGKHKDELADSYNYIFNSFYTPTFDGSHLSFPGLAKEKNGKPFDLRTHQKNATYMGLIQGRCLFAHEVGTGKTYVMGALAMEAKRLGLAHKTLILAKTANYISVANDIREEYPGAKVLVIDEKGDNAGGQIAEAMVGDWDIIVAPHSQMNLFLLSDEGYAKIEQEIRGEIREEMERVSGAAEIPGAIWRLIDGELKVTDEEVQTAIKKVKKSLKENSLEIKNILDSLKQRIRLLEKYGEAVKAAKHIPFEKLGIDQILVDEAHEFKKPGLFTRNQIKGLEINTSDMALKLRILTDNIIDRYGRNVHLFTGTPITNTAVELYQMMRYLMKPEMEAAHICSFDSWFAQYGKAESSLVKKTTGDYEEEIRFVGFKNLPDLRRLYGMNFDFVKTKDMPEFTERKVDGHTLTDPDLTEKEKKELENGRTEGADDVPYHKIVHERIDLSDDVKNFANRIAEASKKYANASGKEKQKLDKIGFEGNPLVAMRLLNQVALDPRLVGLPDYAGSKIQKCADNIMNEYESNKKVSQVVFMDTGVSDTRSINARDNSGESIRDENGKIVKEKVTGWNTAQALKDELVNRGIPEDEIVILSSDDKILKALKIKYKEKYNLPKQPETDELKKLIADEVNNCEVRVVIGTRSMLGTGINMQHNLKAMHQLDAPWMPGELEQSQGRGIRQGNQWNTVKEYRYITDLDAIKWARLAIKQSFITAIKDQKGTNREIEMDESMGSDIGGAEGDIYLTLSFAAQDNRLQEQKRLDKKVHKLENVRKAFYRGQEVKEREATKEKAELPQLKSVQEGLTRLVNMKTDEELAIRGIKKGEKQTDALARLENEMREKGYPKVVLGTYNGLTISGQRTTGYDTNLYVGDGKDDVLVKTISGGLNGRTLISTVTTALPQKIKAITGQIEKSKRDISEWEKTKDDTFPNEEALQKAIKRRNAIREDLKMNPEKPPAWLREKVPINSTVLVHGKPTIIRSYWTPKNAEGQKVHYLIDDAGDAYHISEITDSKTGRNPYEDDLVNEPTDIKPENKNAVETNADGDTKGAADTETQETNTEDNTKYSVAEDEETIKNTSKDEKTEEEKESEIRKKALKESADKLKDHQEKWAKKVDEFMEAKTKDYTNEPIFIMDSPVLFDLFGAEQLPVKITTSVMWKILKDKHVHPDMIQVMKNLPILLSRPVAVVRNRDIYGKPVDKNKEILIFVEQEIDGVPVNVAIKFHKINNAYFMKIINPQKRMTRMERERDYGHRIKTVFRRTDTNRLADAIRDNELLYWDTKKGALLYAGTKKGDTSSLDASSLTAAPSIPGKQAPVTVADTSFLSDHNISDNNRNVKSDTTQSYSKMRKENPEGYLAAMKAQIGEDVYNEKDLDNLIVEAYKKNHETRYQGTTIQSETKAYTLSDVKTSFKGQDVKQVGKNGFEVTFKNGNKVTITQTGEITRSDGKKIRGKYIKGNITLTNLANAFTLDHEIFHFAKDCLYTQKEWAFIEKKVRALLAREGNKNPTADEIEDRAADWYADWKYKRAHPSGVMQKLFHMVYDFVSRVTDLVHKNVNTRFSNLANGDLFERQMTDNHGNTMKYSTVEETNDAVEKTTKDIAEDTEHGFNMFTKAVSALKNFNKKDGRYNNITVEMNTNSFNWIKYGVMNPDHLAKNNETLKVFTDLGKNSMRELQHLRNDTEEKLNKIAKAIEGKDKNGNVRRELYDRIMEEGELNGEEYTREELVVEGIDKGVIDAYLETRKMYNDFYKMVDATKRGVETFHKTVNINGVEALRADTFVENLNVKPLANGRYEVTFGLAKKYPHFGEKVAGSDLKELLSSNYAKVNDIRDKDGVAVKIESTDDIKDDETYSVDYVTVPKPLSNIKGYFHHFFENWMVYEKVTDESGAVSYVPVGSYRSRREALQAFKKLDDLLHEDKKYTREELEVKGIDRNVIDTYMSTMMDNPALGAHEYVIRPKEFHMPMNGGVALGDVKFEQAMRAIEAKYEVNEDEARKLAKGILKKKVGHRFLGATMHRTGQKGYSTDMLHVLHMYTTKATRYIALERFKNKAYRAFERFFGVPIDESKKGGLQQYIKKYIEDVNGNPTRIEEMFNELINNLTGGKLAKWFGTDRPFMSWSNTVMAYSAVLKLGLFNISSAAINLTQLTNAVTLLGIKPFLKAHWITGRFTDTERKFLKDVGVETQLGLDAGAGYDKNRMTSIQNKLINYSLFTFTWSEQKVRQITALMAFAEAKRRGMSYEEAVEFAQRANDDANFDYGVNNAPLFIRAGGPVTQMMFQFMKFPVNQIAFMTDIIRHGTNAQRARLMIPLVSAGVYGVPFWAAVICPALAAAVAGAAGDDYDDPELYLKKKCYEWAGDDPFWNGFLDVAFYGLPAKFGVNIGRRMGIGDFGGDVSKSLRGGKYGYDLGDLSLSLFGGVMFSSIKQAMTQWGNGNVIEAIKAFSPALGNAAQAVVGERRTTRGRVATRYDDISTRIIKALGFMPIEETKEGEKERILKEERRIKTRSEQRIIDDFIRAKEDGDKKRMHDLIETMRKKGIKPKRVADEIKRKSQTGLERAEDFGKKKQDKKPNTRKRYDGRLKHYSLKRSHEKGNSYDSLYNM